MRMSRETPTSQYRCNSVSPAAQMASLIFSCNCSA